jgi:DNA-binding SARP family transcriptional activator/predicted ATPase
MPRLSMRFLGGYQVQLDGEPVTALKYDKVRALLAYLAVEAERPHRREALAGLLWPELTERRARRNLSQVLHILRSTLDIAGSPFLTVTSQAIQFDRARDHWLDVRAYTSLLSACREHGHWRLETCPPCIERLDRAVALYEGPFLQGLSLGDCPAFEEWQIVWDAQLHQLATHALASLAASHEARGGYEQALRAARRWVALDPWHEAAHQQLMRALALGGRRNEALAQYEACCRTLAVELGVEPTEATVSLYKEIHDEKVLSTPIPPLLNNLPAPTTPFVGREALLDELRGLLQDPDCRLVTLVGPGGSGKTRLALQAGAEVAAQAPYDRFPDGVHWISVASLRAGECIAPAIARVLGYGSSPGVDPASSLLGALRRKRLLLILDNYEQLLDGLSARRLCGAGALVEILNAAAGVQVLVTSRARLNVLAEHVLPVGGMAFPSAQEEGEAIAQHSAVALFMERVRAVQPTFAPDGVTLGQVGRICRLVEGLPLAILLSSSWIDVLSPAEIADRVAASLDLLAADLDDLPARQTSVRAVFDASWSHLSPQACVAFARMSVFCGGFTGEAASAVAGADLRTLRELVRTSFLQRTEKGRYETHELLRQYGVEQLAKIPADRTETLDRHCATYAAFYAQRAEEVWKTGIGAVAAEIENIQAAWRRAVAHDRVVQVRTFMGRLIGGLPQLYYSLGWSTEATQTFVAAVQVLRRAERSTENDVALAIAMRCQALYDHWYGCGEGGPHLIRESMDTFCRAGAMDELALAKICASFVVAEDDEVEKECLLQEGLAIARQSGCEFGIGWASHLLGGLAVRWQAYREGEAYLQDAIRAFRHIGHRRGGSWVVESLAELAYCRADYAKARARATESMAMCEQIGWMWRVVGLLLLLGKVALAQGAGNEARTYFEDARVRAHDIGDDRLLAFALCGLGDAALAGQDVSGARSAYRQALEIATADPRDELGWRALPGLAMLASREGCPARAVALVALAQSALAPTLSPLINITMRRLDLRLWTGRLYAELQRQLPPDAFAAAQERGQSTSLRATVEALLEELCEDPNGLLCKDR